MPADFWLQPSRFPSPTQADGEGLIACGGSLAPEWLLDAYSHGIFPWPVPEVSPLMLWWSLDPRAVLDAGRFHISRRLRRRLRQQTFKVTCDQAFPAVLQGCATAPGRSGETWLTDEMIAAYLRMHELGYAHSVECWYEGELAGGVYGLAIRGLFAAESMFRYRTDASKVALAHLVAHLETRGFVLLDVQQLTEHTASLGGREIPRSKYLTRLAHAMTLAVEFGGKLTGQP